MGGLGMKSDAMYEFHAQYGIKPQRGHGRRHDANGSVIRWCYVDPAIAKTFAAVFWRERITSHGRLGEQAMTRLPTDAHELTGFEDYGVDQKGVHVFFGFQLKDAAAAVLHCNYKQLGQCIVYLQDIAQEAFRRRDPASAHQEVRETQSDFVRQLDFEVDVTGDSAALLCTTLDGHRIELQIPHDILQELQTRLRILLAEMDIRRAQRQHRQ